MADWHALLGTVSDAAIAREHGVPRPCVRSERLRLGIPPAPGVGGRPSAARDYAALRLDEVPAAEVARQLGVTRVSVFRARKKLGVPAPPRTRRPNTTAARLHDILVQARPGARFHTARLAARLGRARKTVAEYLRKESGGLVELRGLGTLACWVRVEVPRGR